METPRIELDENHVYRLEGKTIDGLTSTIAEAGLIRDNGDPWYMKRGTLIHLATEYWDRGELDESTVDTNIQGYLESWKRFRKDQNYEPKEIEFKTYHPTLLVGTTVDRLPGPLDIKSGSSEPWHVLQVAFQWACLREHGFRDSTDQPMDVYLDPDGGSPKVKFYTTSEIKEAFKVYCYMLYFTRWKRQKGVK